MNKLIPAGSIAAAAGGWYVYQQQQYGTLPETFAQSNGRPELNRIDMDSLYPGRMQKILVGEGSEVQECDVPAELLSDTIPAASKPPKRRNSVRPRARRVPMLKSRLTNSG